MQIDKASVNSLEVKINEGTVQLQNENVYLRSDKQLTVSCEVDSNPKATCEWEYDNKVLEGGCNTQLEISSSSLVKCRAKNYQYENEFDEKSLNVTIVDVDSKLI